MKLLKCNTGQMTLTLVELPRQNWRVLPPGRLQVAITLAGIALTALVWGLL